MSETADQITITLRRAQWCAVLDSISGWTSEGMSTGCGPFLRAAQANSLDVRGMESILDDDEYTGHLR